MLRSPSNPSPARRTLLACTLAAAMLAGCRPTPVRTFDRSPVTMPEAFGSSAALLEDAASDPRPAGDPAAMPEPWWRSFGDDGLDAAVDSALAGNLDLRQAWHRLRQAAAEVAIAGAASAPSLDASLSGTGTRLGDREPEFPSDGSPGNRWDERYALGLGLSWEVDVWGRLAAREQAATLRARATRADVSDAALLVTAGVVEAWFTVQEQRALLNLLEDQLQTSRTLLELTELRFSLGEGSSVAVLQQRSQVAATESQLPAAESRLAAARHRLAVLLGRTPEDLGPHEPGAALPDLPPLPPLAAPAELLRRRPDIRAAVARLEAADREVAEAVADRWPRLSLSLSADWTTAAIGAAFQRDLLTAAAGVLLPLADGGRRTAEVRRREAIVQRQLDALGGVVLVALQEVEDALSRERHQRELLRRRAHQLTLSRETLEETRRRYANGLGDYIDVIVSLQSLQQLERQVLGEEVELLVNRARLHRAFGGLWMEQLDPAAPRDLDAFASAAGRGAAPAIAPESAPESTPEPTPASSPESLP